MSYDEVMRQYVVERPSADGFHVGWLRKVGDDITDQCVFLMGSQSGRHYCGIYEGRPRDCRDFRRSAAATSTNRCPVRRQHQGRTGIHAQAAGPQSLTVSGCEAIFAARFSLLSARRPLRRRYYGDLHWRFIGPMRGGGTVALAGVPDRPNLFYIAAVNGGIWKTEDAGRTWQPIFDGQPTGSIGALAVSPSDPRIVYAGSGEGLQRPDLAVGDGIYKSSDAGATWTHLGLRDGQQIRVDGDRSPRIPTVCSLRCSGIRTDPTRNAASTGRSTAARPSPACSIQTRTPARSTWCIDPNDPQTVYATLWAARQAPWENRCVL